MVVDELVEVDEIVVWILGVVGESESNERGGSIGGPEADECSFAVVEELLER